MISITPRQLDLLQTLAAYTTREGVAPSNQDLADALGIDSKSVRDKLMRLELDGYIQRKPRVARSIRLTKLGENLLTDRKQ